MCFLYIGCVMDLEDSFVRDKSALERQFESRLRYTEQVFLQKEQQLLDKNATLRLQCTDLEQYKMLREELAAQLEQTKAAIQKNERQHKLQLDQLEQTFLQARDQLQVSNVYECLYIFIQTHRQRIHTIINTTNYSDI